MTTESRGSLDRIRYFSILQPVAKLKCMSESSPSEPVGQEIATPDEAQLLLASVPPRPRRQLEFIDHVSAAATILCSLAAGLVALSGHPWWAILPAVCALITSHVWMGKRLNRANEPRLKATTVTVTFTVWLLIPVWRGIMRGETIPFPESLIFAGFAPAAWLVFYIVLLIRR